MTDHLFTEHGIEISILAGFSHPTWIAKCVALAVEAFASVEALRNIRNQRLCVSKSKDSWPRAVEFLDQGRQRVDLPSDGNACAQVIYYLGHELGHIVSGFERRFSQDDKRNLWMEEIVCGATSLYALQYASQHWKHADYFARGHFNAYLEELYKGEFTLPNSALPADEFVKLAVSESGLALSMRPFSRLLFERVGQAVAADACSLATIKPGLNQDQFLDQWAAACKSSPSSPTILRQMWS